MQYADSKNLFDQLSEDFSRKCTTTSQPINYLKFCNNNGQINTDLDIQRGYQWDEKRQQEMWNSLLLNAHIPEFHALIRNDIYDYTITKIEAGLQVELQVAEWAEYKHSTGVVM